MPPPHHGRTDRRTLLRAVALGAVSTAASASDLPAQTPGPVPASPVATPESTDATPMNKRVSTSISVNDRPYEFDLDPRASLLDVLREQAGLMGTKKGCDHGQCGACTVHIDGQRVLSCLTLAVQAHQRKVTTIEGLASTAGDLHPMQQAFIDHDALQCGYCTPGQIMAAVACLEEGLTATDAQIREAMSGNLCRCGAYVGIVNAIRDVADRAGEG